MIEIDAPTCRECGSIMARGFDGIVRCGNCGQAVAALPWKGPMEAPAVKPHGLKSEVQIAIEMAEAEGAPDVDARAKEILRESRERHARISARLDAKLKDAAGAKHDTGKPRYSLLPWRAIDEVVAVLEHGVAKYGEDNWRLVPNAHRRYIDAAMRHIRAVLSDVGEDCDPESGRHHLAHAVCSLLFVLELEEEMAARIMTMNEPDPGEVLLQRAKGPCRCGHERPSHIRGLAGCLAATGPTGENQCGCKAFDR